MVQQLGSFLLFGRYIYVPTNINTDHDTTNSLGSSEIEAATLNPSNWSNSPELEEIIRLVSSLNRLFIFQHDSGAYIIFDCVVNDAGLLEIYSRVKLWHKSWADKPYYDSLMEHAAYIDTFYSRPNMVSDPRSVEWRKTEWRQYFRNFRSEVYIRVQTKSAETKSVDLVSDITNSSKTKSADLVSDNTKLLDSIIDLYRDEPISAAELYAVSDRHSYLSCKHPNHPNTIPLSGMRVRDGAVIIYDRHGKLEVNFKGGLANGSYSYYSYEQGTNYFGQSRDGVRVGKQYYYFCETTKLYRIRDHDHDHEYNIDLTGQEDNPKISISFKGDQGCSESEWPPHSYLVRGSSQAIRYRYSSSSYFDNYNVSQYDVVCCSPDYLPYYHNQQEQQEQEVRQSYNTHSQDADVIHVVVLLKCGNYIGDFSFNNRTMQLIGPAQPLSLRWKLYYLSNWLLIKAMLHVLRWWQ